MKLTVEAIAKAVKAKQGRGDKKTVITGVEFDSRKITAGNLFVPLAGARDGHDFIEQAIANGATATLWSRSLEEAPKTITVILVAEILPAMQALAKFYLKTVAPDVIAITGSNGKTTTKDMTEAVLAQKFATYKTQGNYNNDIGLPYTILQMPDTTEKLILEMGMDHFGEIELLSQIAEPTVAAITMVGEAHIENLGSRAGIAKAKMEIVSGLQKNGVLFIPADEELLANEVAELPQKVKTFGLAAGDIAGRVIAEEAEATTFEVAGGNFTIPVIGAYNVSNALIAYGIGTWFGLTIAEIREGLGSFQLTKNRTEWLKAANGADILSDVYNANPTAMALVIDTFVKLPRATGKKYLVLADMLALGEQSFEMHASLESHIQPADVAEVFLYGPEMMALYVLLVKKFPQLNVHHFDQENKAGLINSLKKVLQPEDAVMLKGSNGMQLNQVVAALMEQAEEA
ncbi:UDP-N-acetylmuramoyl-tripeptide--D-alanyl-D-alanine ligase [Enterococcus sp. PF1-24]|uniref:UDP-N-acetylmuramoyl-tripeptide--D-alanyl-D- alanine ligase n=1 Tax=unclassified Enterococcus TaxID=2608891 RepID=UPI00247726FD|nr:MULTISPECIES: UDP-N-acetylmuramoyl-tripeptide--D-alanyl-D-alanine ligase [unclassified Enterococcus]MDH6364877.1 UDP-N-acetylmuramoyl-tripeptide--D-alanyl-D-alanine ligase [Enterococcus sp. PFB1-1]MDH6401978.1 UDP-N-acetylmuramoyl-tripeptide--D-alanyl-D-alanine ligase [Enterococcus sp. PF1-24]